MKLKLLFTLPLLLCLFTIKSQGQVLWSENFETGGSSKMSLNTADAGSNATAINQWFINNAYQGGTGTNTINCDPNSLLCSFFGVCTSNLTYDSHTTPDEPAAVSGASSSNFKTYYLHIDDSTAFHYGIKNATWAVPDGSCVPTSNTFAKMNSGVSTLGLSNVYMSFFWVCHGDNNNVGKIYYSIDGGSNWIQLTSPRSIYNNISAWQKDSVHLPAFDNVSDLRFGFMWAPGSPNGSTLDPSFSLDDISVYIPTNNVSPTITTGTLSPAGAYCNATAVNVSVPYTINNGPLTGTFTAYLSDASGNFSPGTPIGSGTTSPISATLPQGTTAGSGYKIKVENGNTASTASASFTITAATAASISITSSGNSICQGSSVSFNSTTSTPGATFQWYLDGNPISGATNATYSSSSLADGNVITCKVSSTSPCVSGTPATSNTEVMSVTGSISGGTVTSSKDTICTNTVAHLSVGGYTNGATLQWQSSSNNTTYTDVSGATAATYTTAILNSAVYYRVVVTNGGCTANSTVLQINVLPSPHAAFTESAVGYNATFNSDSTTGASSYTWDFGDGNSSTVPNTTHTYDTAGTYHVCLTVKNSSNCNFTVCKNLTVFPLGVNNIDNNTNWNIYPDPFTDKLFITTNMALAEVKNVELYDVLGRLAYSKEVNNSKVTPLEIDVNDLKAGMYFLRINLAHSSYVKSIIKQ